MNNIGNHSETDPELAGFVPNIISKQCGTDNGFWHPTSSTFCVICNSKDAGGVLKIFQAMGTIISKTSVISQSSYILEGILSAYSFRKDLSSMENASVLFSLLLNYGSGQLSANPGCSFSSKDACSWSLESELNAHSNLQTQFVEACKIDINSLVTLMENFLHHKEIYTYKTSKDNLGAIGYQFSKENPHISYGSASLIQLVAGSMILASICKLFKDISFLVKLSFQILRWTPQSNFSSVLVILHTFVSVCKESFFSAAENKMSTIVKSVVQHLELGQSSPDLQSAEILPTCKDCPFSQGALSLDELLLFLMIEMEQYPSNTSKLHSRKTECVSKKLENSENGYTSCLLQNKHVASEDCDDLWLQCDASCVRCSLIDDISLLELTMYYADWHWTFENIIPSLFKMVQSFHVEERYSSIVITLFGIFGRMGVDAFGYDHDQVVELRKQICTLLDSLDNGDGSRMSKASLGLEIRVVEAMLKLLPMSFKEICGIDLENQADKRLPSCVCTQSIRKWFSQLSEIQKNRCVVYTNFMPECWNYGWVRQSVFFAPVLKR